DSDTDYDSVPASPEPLMTRQTRNSIRNAIPPAAGPNGRRLAWNMFIRPGMAGGFRKRFSEREINTLLKNNWLG
uniref:Uncharacterized protein n=1 Tax=Panagrolaimus sp. JU765 TaxID=591449 RepID=A0AC34RJF9_9BILA